MRNSWMVTTLILLAACGGDDPCPEGLVTRGPGACQVPVEVEVAGRAEAGRIGDRPAGILPPSGGRGGTGGEPVGGKDAGHGGGAGKASGGAGAVAVAVPRGGSGGSDADAGEPAAPVVVLPPAPRCGDDIVQMGEVCDGNCPADCDDGDPCTDDHFAGKAETCDFRCMHTVLPTGSSCGYGERTCHAGVCYSETEIAMCGNGTLDPGETCDTKSADKACVTECVAADACHTVQLIGHSAACSARCLLGVARAGNVCPGGRCNDAGTCVKVQEQRI
jgi:hypothetical protein